MLLQEIQKDVYTLKCQSCGPLALPVHSQLFQVLRGKAGEGCGGWDVEAVAFF